MGGNDLQLPAKGQKPPLFPPFLLGRVLASHYGAISYLTVSQKNISRKENYQFILSELVLEDSGTTVSSISG